MIRLLGRKTSGNVQKVLWALNEMKLEFVREDYGRQFNNTGGDYLKMNPNAKVPTLVDGDAVIWESNTILRYLGNKTGGKFYATDAAKRTYIERWMDWQLATIDGNYLTVFREAKTEPDKRSAAFAPAVTGLGQALTIMDNQLDGRTWLTGNEKTIADFCLGPIVHRCLNFGVDLPALKRVHAWRDQIIADKKVAEIFAG